MLEYRLRDFTWTRVRPTKACDITGYRWVKVKGTSGCSCSKCKDLYLA